jgi:hypothetical protein
MFFFNKHAPTFYPIFFTQKGIPLDYIKMFFSLLVATMYSMSSMQWNMAFCSLHNSNKKESSQCSFIFYELL